jgi:hypothetical protein
MTIKYPVVRKVKLSDELSNDEVFIYISEPGNYAIRIEETNV